MREALLLPNRIDFWTVGQICYGPYGRICQRLLLSMLMAIDSGAWTGKEMGMWTQNMQLRFDSRMAVIADILKLLMNCRLTARWEAGWKMHGW